MPSFGQASCSLVVDGESVDVVVEGVEPRGRDDPRLPHRAAEQELLPPCELDQVRRAGEDRAEWAAEALREAERHGVDAGGDRGSGHAERDRRVEKPRSVQVNAETAGARRGRDGLELVERPHATAGDVVGVLEDEHGRLLVDDVLRARSRLGHLRRRNPPSLTGQADREEPGVDCRAAELVAEDVRQLVGDEDVTRPAVELEGDLVRHRRRRHEDRTLLAEKVRRTLLQLVDGGILLHLLVADGGRGDRGAHARRRPCDGVRAEVDHACPFCTPDGRVVRSSGDRDRRRRV